MTTDVIKQIRRKTRRKFSADEKIRIVLGRAPRVILSRSMKGLDRSESFRKIIITLVVIVCTARAAPAADHEKQFLPHRVKLADGAHAAGFSYQYGNANCGWIALSDHTVLIDVPRDTVVADYLKLVRETTGRPAKTLVLTNLWADPKWGFPNLYDREKKRWLRGEGREGPEPVAPIIEALVQAGITKVITTPKIKAQLLKDAPGLSGKVEGVEGEKSIGDSIRPIEFFTFDTVREEGAAAVYLPRAKVLFGGPLVYTGSRPTPAGKRTSAWIQALEKLAALDRRHLVPGFGTWDDGAGVERLYDYLFEFHDQVAHAIAEGYSLEETQQERVRIPNRLLFWSGHSRPRPDDIEHLYRELTVPSAPFYGEAPRESDPRPHALVVIGDSPHPPVQLEDALRRVFEATVVVPHFTVDVEALSAANLAKVDLFVILRDGRQVPRKGPRPKLRALEDPLHGTIRTWMTLEQEQAVVGFVERGGSFLNLHNSLGLYPPAGPYLKLVGGRYIGHGPFERFRIEVADPDHPITEGVSDFTTADEQHTPVIYDESLVHHVLRSRMDNGTVVAAGWVREAGRGRICHLASGHPVEPLLHPMYQRLMRNAVEWCLRKR